MYDLEHLNTFLAVVEHGGFLAAADAMHCAQSRVTQHVAVLERAVGAELFDRKKRPVQLTEAGQIMVDQARRVLRALADAEAAMQPWGLDAQHQIVRLGVYAGVGAAFVPYLLHRLAQDHPSITVTWTEHPTSGLDAALDRAQVDLCLRPLHPTPLLKKVERVPLWSEPVLALHAADHPMAALPDPITADQLLRYPVLALGGLDTTGSDTALPHRLHQHDPTSAPTRTIGQPHTLVALAASGLGVAIAPGLSLHGTDTTGVQVRLLPAGTRHRIALCRVTTRPLTPAAAKVRDTILTMGPPPGTIAAEPLREAARAGNS